MDAQKRAQAALSEREQQAQTLAQELAAVNEELRAANEEIRSSNEELGLTNGQLTRLNSDLENFVYTASHDLKSPIANLEGFQRVLLGRLSGRITEQEQQMLLFMQQATHKLNQTINDLTEIARIQSEAGEQEHLSFRQMLLEVRQDIASLIEQSAARIEVELAVELVVLPRKHLRSILYNLLSNALKYRSPDRESWVRVTTRQQGNLVVLSVEDNGLGLDESQQSRLFQLFKRMHVHVEGTGVGLYMVKRMVESNAGRIGVESQPGVGSTFRVYFPHLVH
jgi:signal transduction histidine kinase